MSSNRTTQGRLPASVYRRRRAMVLLGLVAVIVAIVLVIVRPGVSQGEEVAKTTPASAPPTTSATPAASAAATPEPEPAPSAAAPVDGAACVDAQITVEAVTDATVYAADEKPNLSVTITNTGTNSCVIDVGTAAQVFTVKSGNEVYWSSTDCQVDPVPAEVTLEPEQAVSSSEPLVWDRTRSSADSCDGERSAVPGGGASYHLAVSVDGFESESTKQFLLY
jgi:hypothetical protein